MCSWSAEKVAVSERLKEDCVESVGAWPRALPGRDAGGVSISSESPAIALLSGMVFGRPTDERPGRFW